MKNSGTGLKEVKVELIEQMLSHLTHDGYKIKLLIDKETIPYEIVKEGRMVSISLNANKETQEP